MKFILKNNTNSAAVQKFALNSNEKVPAVLFNDLPDILYSNTIGLYN